MPEYSGVIDASHPDTFDAVDPSTGEVVEFRRGSLDLPGRVSSVGLELPEGLSFETWESIGARLQSVERSVQWWLGDWMRYGEARRWGEMYDRAVVDTGRSKQALADAKYVAARFQFSCRHENLSWSHHWEAARLDPADADELLDAAEREGWSTRDLRAEVNRRKNAIAIGATPPAGDTCTVEDLMRLVGLGQRFGCIYADPPWLYDNQGTRASTGNHYGGLTVDELCALPIRDLAADDAHLHLWTTNGFLFECPRIFEAWGFEFRSSFVWVKPQMGIGNYWRNSHEFLLTAIRGNAKRFNDKSLMSWEGKSWLECDRGAHSAKPEQVRAMLERASPGPYLELFGRSAIRNWTVWGNQIAKSLLCPDVLEVA